MPSGFSRLTRPCARRARSVRVVGALRRGGFLRQPAASAPADPASGETPAAASRARVVAMVLASVAWRCCASCCCCASSACCRAASCCCAICTCALFSAILLLRLADIAVDGGARPDQGGERGECAHQSVILISVVTESSVIGSGVSSAMRQSGASASRRQPMRAQPHIAGEGGRRRIQQRGAQPAEHHRLRPAAEIDGERLGLQQPEGDGDQAQRRRAGAAGDGRGRRGSG